MKKCKSDETLRILSPFVQVYNESAAVAASAALTLARLSRIEQLIGRI